MSKDAPKTEPAPVAIADIPLPPEDQWDELDNEPARAPARTGGQDAAEKAAPRPAADIADLEFEGSGHLRMIPLKFPFRHPETGEWVRKIAVERLPIGEVGRLVEKFSGQTYDKFEIYSLMTGLPAPVLRGLKDVDGDEVTGVAYDFLPRVFRPASGSNQT
jgi:hypothetical protein